MLIAPIEILKEAWQIYKANWKPFFKILAWLFIPIILLTIVDIINEATQLKFKDIATITYLILSALSFVVGLWANIILVRLTWSSLTRSPVEKKKLSEEAWRDTAPYLWISILTGLIIFFGTLLFIIPGIIFTVWYSLATFVFVLEGTRGYKALQRSRELIEGRFWSVVWRWIVPTAISIVIATLLVGIPSLIIGLITQFIGFNPASQTIPWWSTFLNRIGSLLILPVTLAIGMLIFKSLKENAIEKKSA